MYVDPTGVAHPEASDPVTVAGLKHLDSCVVCMVARPWLHVAPRYLPTRAEFEALYQYHRPLERGPMMQSAQRLRESGYTTEVRHFRRSLRCWLGLHNWHEQANSIYDLCVRCGARERAF